jgi:hypothetical protein
MCGLYYSLCPVTPSRPDEAGEIQSERNAGIIENKPDAAFDLLRIRMSRRRSLHQRDEPSPTIDRLFAGTQRGRVTRLWG